MLETENTSVILKNKLAEAESAISVLRDERGAATITIEKLEDELEQKRTSVAQLDALRIEHTAMVSDFNTVLFYFLHWWVIAVIGDVCDYW